MGAAHPRTARSYVVWSGLRSSSSAGSSQPCKTHTTRCLRKAGRILKDYYHPAFRLFTPLPSGRRYRIIRSRTRRLENSFSPRAIRLLNGHLTHYRHFCTRHLHTLSLSNYCLYLHLHTVSCTTNTYLSELLHYLLLPVVCSIVYYMLLYVYYMLYVYMLVLYV